MDRADAQNMARTLMNEHGLERVSFGFDNCRTRMGVAHFLGGVCHLIELSGPLVELNAADLVRNTILHEIAHAKAGVHAGHGYEWKRVAQAIGCTGDRCCPPDVVKVPGKYIAKCPGCGDVRHAYRLPKRNGRFACAACCKGVYNSQFAFYYSEVK